MEFKKNKRGLSAIVATLLLILLAIIAFAIVSVVIKNTVGNSAEKIDLGQKCLDIEIHSTGITKYVGTNYYGIGFTRSNSGETVDGMKVVLTDSNGDIIKKDLTGQIEPLSKWTENVSFNNSVDFIPARITMIPYFMRESGDIYYCDPGQTDEINLVNGSFTGSVIAPLTGGVISPFTGNNIIKMDMNLDKAEDPKAALNSLKKKYEKINFNEFVSSTPLNLNQNTLNQNTLNQNTLNKNTKIKSLSTSTNDGTENCYSTELNKVLKNCASSLSSSTDLTATKVATTASCNEDCYKQGISYALQVCNPNYVPMGSVNVHDANGKVISNKGKLTGACDSGDYLTWDGTGCYGGSEEVPYTAIINDACCGH